MNTHTRIYGCGIVYVHITDSKQLSAIHKYSHVVFVITPGQVLYNHYLHNNPGT